MVASLNDIGFKQTNFLTRFGVKNRTGRNTLGIQSPCQMMIGVYNHLQNARYLGSITILKGDWIAIGIVVVLSFIFLDGGLKHFLLSPLLGEMIQFD